MEKWKPVPGYEGLYEVSDIGNVRSVDKFTRHGHLFKGKELSKTPVSSGYLRVVLSVDGKVKHAYVHRLVASAFIPNPEGKTEVNHKDGDKKNNCISNLEWVTHSENGTHSFRVLGREHPKPMLGKRGANARFTDDQIRTIRTDNRLQRVIAKEYEVTQTAIGRIKRGEVYRYVV